MKRSLLLAVSVTATIVSTARPNPDRIPIDRQKIIFSDTSLAQIPSMNEMLEEITQAMGLQNNFVLREAGVRNIEATIRHKKRMILYNPAFIDWINKATRNKWGAMALLAHEMGHHLKGHTMHKTGSQPALELEADEFAGFVLRKLGASLVESQEVMLFIATSESTKTHPARNARMLAIRNGWTKATEAGLASASKKVHGFLPHPQGTELPR